LRIKVCSDTIKPIVEGGEAVNWQVRINIWGRAATDGNDWTPPEKRINRIYYVHGGRGYYEMDGVVRPFEHRKLYVLPDTVHIQVSQESEDPMDHTFFDFDVIPGFCFRNIICIDVEQHPLIGSMIEVFQEMIHAYGNDLVRMWSAEILAVMNSLLSNLLFMISKVQSLSSTSDARILSTLSYIHDNFDKKLSIEELAAKVFLDKDYFIRLFTRNTGQTPHAYIRNRRMHYAMTLLQQGMPAKNVAGQCGYDSYCAFSRTFKGYYGCPPTGYLNVVPITRLKG